MVGILWSLGLSLCVTLLLESAAALALGIRQRRDLLLVILVNVLTNPVVVLTLSLFLFAGRTPPWYLVLALEAAAVAVEALLYRSRLEYRRIHPLLLSLILNSISYIGGLLL